MKYCTNCGTKLQDNAKFCGNCGEKINLPKFEKLGQETKNAIDKHISPYQSNKIIEKINRKITVQNNQTSIVKILWSIAGIFLLIIIVAFSEIIEIHPAIVMLSIFFFIMAIIVGFMFRSREKKLQSLISGESTLAQWILTPEQKKTYVDYLFMQEAGKNKIILFSISVIAIIVFGLFILFIDEGKLAMLEVLVGLIIFLSLFAFGMPYYYRYSNKRGDGNVLIGGKYAYINGYFHNWDFPLSGLSKVKVIKKPFYGINLVYYYTDSTLSHSEELFIPANKEEDLEELVRLLKLHNTSSHRKKNKKSI